LGRAWVNWGLLSTADLEARVVDLLDVIAAGHQTNCLRVVDESDVATSADAGLFVRVVLLASTASRVESLGRKVIGETDDNSAWAGLGVWVVGLGSTAANGGSRDDGGILRVSSGAARLLVGVEGLSTTAVKVSIGVLDDVSATAEAGRRVVGNSVAASSSRDRLGLSAGDLE